MSQEATDLFTRLAPVLNVRDLAAERVFYERLGLPVIYDGTEYAEFIGFGTETVHFGIQKATADNDPPSVLTWQIGVTDIDAAMERCRSAGIAFEIEHNNPGPGGPIGACSSVPRAATGWHSKAPTNNAAEPLDSRPGLQFGLQFTVVQCGSEQWCGRCPGAGLAAVMTAKASGAAGGDASRDKAMLLGSRLTSPDTVPRA
jgi:catechol 2,3-dioxygenase-like lactoylglutathione lyase family enzyme